MQLCQPIINRLARHPTLGLPVPSPSERLKGTVCRPSDVARAYGDLPTFVLIVPGLQGREVSMAGKTAVKKAKAPAVPTKHVCPDCGRVMMSDAIQSVYTLTFTGPRAAKGWEYRHKKC